MGKKKDSPDKKAQGSGDARIDAFEKQLKLCVEKLDCYLDAVVCKEQFNESDGKIYVRNLVHTKEFFYKDRYAIFVEFVIALYKNGAEAGEKALQDMLGSSRCRFCNQAFCMRNVLAKALLYERQGRIEEAKQLYQSLYAGQNYNLFAWCGARMRED